MKNAYYALLTGQKNPCMPNYTHKFSEEEMCASTDKGSEERQKDEKFPWWDLGCLVC